MILNDHSLSAEAIKDGLRTRTLARQVVYFERVGSTNAIARQLADAGEPEGTLVIADEQSAGRGRLGRRWIAPARSSLLMSLVLRPGAISPTVVGGEGVRHALLPSESPRVTMAVGLAVCSAIRAETGLDTRLKWHNDILVNGKKCAGILVESGIVGDALEYVIAGLGVNVNFTAASVEGIPPDATTIADQLGRPFPRVPLAQAILQRIECYYLRLCAGENLRAEWVASLATLHRHVRAETPWGIEEGFAEDVDDDGALLLRRADGTRVSLIVGDVTLSVR